jgi:hypothetical protein
MPEIVNLDELVPEDITFVYQSKEYVVPGDLDTETVFKIFQHLKALLELRDADGGLDEDGARRAAEAMGELLLNVFRIRQPDMRELPFGTRGRAIIAERLLDNIGVGGAAREEVPSGRANRSKRRRSPSSHKPKAPVSKS